MITVTTGGPEGDVAPFSPSAELTYADIVRQISDELDDTNDSYLPQIQNAVAAAVRFCAREPLYFNQNIEVSFTAAAGQADYAGAELELGAVQAVFCEDSSGGQIWPLSYCPAPMSAARQGENYSISPMSVTVRSARQGENYGRPQFYGFCGAALRLSPIPDRAYNLRLVLNPANLQNIPSAGENAGERNPWFSQGFALIKARAKYALFKDILQDAPNAAAAFNDYREELAALQAETSRRAGINRIAATEF